MENVERLILETAIDIAQQIISTQKDIIKRSTSSNALWKAQKKIMVYNCYLEIMTTVEAPEADKEAIAIVVVVTHMRANKVIIENYEPDYPEIIDYCQKIKNPSNHFAGVRN